MIFLAQIWKYELSKSGASKSDTGMSIPTWQLTSFNNTAQDLENAQLTVELRFSDPLFSQFYKFFHIWFGTNAAGFTRNIIVVDVSHQWHLCH